MPSVIPAAAAGAPARSIVLGRVLVVAALVLAVFVAAFTVQGLREWHNVASAALVNLVPPALLGWGVWRLAASDRPRGWATLVVTHSLAALLFSGAWTGSVILLVSLLEPNALGNFKGAAVWHFTGGLTVYGMIAGLSHAFKISRRLRERELSAARAELIALRAQLDPHFLFNTLHSIGALIRQDPAMAEVAIERFGDLMRYVLGAGRSHLVALEDELTFVRGYLDLEQLRLGQRLSVIEAVDDDCLDCGVPPLLLQPLIENAVRHGLSPIDVGGTLRIAGALLDGRLVLSVVDDGCGADSGTLAAATGLGIAATQRQLAAHFGTAAKLSIDTAPGLGYAATLSLPIVSPGRMAMP